MRPAPGKLRRRLALLLPLWLAGLAYGADNSAFVSQSVPSPMTPGQTYAVSVTMQNTGTSTWSEANQFRLGYVGGGQNWGTPNGRAIMPAADSAAPGATYTFNFNVTAPTTPGIYNFQWKMVQGSVAFFGATTPNVTVAVGQVNHAAFVSQSAVPTSMVANQTYAVSVTMQNVGGTTWVAGDHYLQPQSSAWSPSRVELANSVVPGQSVTFAFNVKPLVAGTLSFQWRMAQGATAFGASSTAVSVSASGTDNSAFVSQSVPSPMVPGQTYAVSVTMQNTGTTTWSEANQFRLGYVAGGQNWGIASGRAFMPAADSAAPGTSYTFNFNVTAPTTPGIYNFQWKMVHGSVSFFGATTPNVAVAVGQVNHAAFVSQSAVPTSMVANQTYAVSITMQNIGGTTWAPGDHYLQPQSTAWSPSRVELANPVAPGQSVTFAFNVKPLVAGTLSFQWRMAQGTTAFGDSSTAVSVTASGTDNSAFVSQSVPSPMTPGQTYAVSVTMQNTGTTTWSEANQLRLGYVAGGQNWGTPNGRAIMPAGDSAAPGTSYTFNFNVTAPTTPGIYNFQWKMVHGSVSFFGATTPNVTVAVGQVNHAAFVSQSAVPSSMVANQTYAVSVTMQNIGGTTWAPGDHNLQAQSPAWSPSRVELANPVAPGQSATFAFNVKPQVAGTLNFQWRMAQGATAFGASSTAVSVSASGTDNSAFVSQSVPSLMLPGQSYAVSVTMQNTGTTTWSEANVLRLGYVLSGQNWGIASGRAFMAAGDSVAPGATYTFNFNVTAPTTPGTYNFQWKMVHGDVAFFGVPTPNVAVSVSVTDDSVFVSQSVPGPMVPGQSYAVSVTMQNTGDTTWSEANLFRLGSRNPQDNTTWGVNRAMMPAGATVPPGASRTFNFNVTAPTTAGTYNFQWQTVHDGVAFFGATTPNVAVAVNGVNDAQLVSQFVPATMVPGHSYAVFVTLKNVGNTTWSAGAYYLGSMNAQDNTTWGLSRVELASPVAAGERAVLSFNVTAPATLGTYNFQWQMTQNGTRFGALTTNVPVSVSNADNAAYVSQSVPSPMVPGQTYAVSVTMQNTGGTTWSPGTYYLGSMNAQDNTTWGLSRVDLNSPVAAGASVVLTFNVTAPTSAGSYNFQWQMTQNGTRFGALTPNVPVSVTTQTTAAQLYFIHTDHLNTPRLIANQAGTTVWRWDNQEPFGSDVPNNNPSGAGAFDFPLRFPGQYFDRETNLAYNWMRDYDPAIGRYVESDPIGLQAGLNTYLYVDGNPVSRTDLNGLISIPPTPAPAPGGSGGSSACLVDDCILKRTYIHNFMVIKCEYLCTFTGWMTTPPNTLFGCKKTLP